MCRVIGESRISHGSYGRSKLLSLHVALGSQVNLYRISNCHIYKRVIYLQNFSSLAAMPLCRIFKITLYVGFKLMNKIVQNLLWRGNGI